MSSSKKILIAVDGTDTSIRAVRYVGEVIDDLSAFEICLLHIYPEPPPAYYRGGHHFDEYQNEKEKAAQYIFSEAIGLLKEKGVNADAIDTICRMASGKTISDTLIQVRGEGGFGTVVVGKRGISKAEEFLFGSISNSVVRNSKDFTVWVVA